LIYDPHQQRRGFPGESTHLNKKGDFPTKRGKKIQKEFERNLYQESSSIKADSDFLDEKQQKERRKKERKKANQRGETRQKRGKSGSRGKGGQNVRRRGVNCLTVTNAQRW